MAARRCELSESIHYLNMAGADSGFSLNVFGHDCVATGTLTFIQTESDP
jgi:hypothetical protein